MRTDLLLLFADRLDVLHAQQAAHANKFRFDIELFHMDTECGTVGCAAGWAMTDPQLREAFQITEQPKEVLFSKVLNHMVAFLGVPPKDKEIFRNMFLPSGGGSYWYRSSSLPTAADVADALRRFAGGERPTQYVWPSDDVDAEDEEMSLKVTRHEREERSTVIAIELDQEDMLDIIAQGLPKWLGDHPARKEIADLMEYDAGQIELWDASRYEEVTTTFTIKVRGKKEHEQTRAL